MNGDYGMCGFYLPKQRKIIYGKIGSEKLYEWYLGSEKDQLLEIKIEIDDKGSCGVGKEKMVLWSSKIRTFSGQCNGPSLLDEV